MKHKHSLARFVHSFANGLVHTPPCSSHKFSRILSLFFLAVTLMVSGNVWGKGNTRCAFTQNETLYFKMDYSGGDWTTASAKFKAKFFSKDDVGNFLGETGELTKVEDKVYSFTVPYNNAGYVMIIRYAPDGGQWGYTVRLSADDAGTRNCITQYAWTENPTPAHWTVYNSGRTCTSKGPKRLDVVGDAVGAGWNVNSWHFTETSSNSGIWWRKTEFKSSTAEFKFLSTDNWGDQYSPISSNKGAIKKDVELPTDGGYTSYDMQFINPDADGFDHKFKTKTLVDNNKTFNVVLDFAHYITNGQNPKMLIFPLKAYVDYGGSRTISAEIDNNGDYVFSSLNIPANATFKFCLKSDGTSTIGATSNNLELTAANQEESIVLDGTNLFKVASSINIKSLKINLATRKVVVLTTEPASAQQWTVTFKPNNGEADIVTKVSDGGAPSAPSPAPTKDGHMLLGWSETNDGEVVNLSSISVTADRTFYAKWVEAVTVSFETYCSQVVYPQAIAMGGKASNPGDLSKIQTQSGNHEVATFKGWYADAACTTAFDFANTTISANSTIYAKWEMRSETFYEVGDLWMNNTTDWNNASNPSFTRSDDKRSISVSYIAPKGLNRFEVIRGNDWNYKVPMDVDPNSSITINVKDGHMNFTLDKIQKVTITYNGRFSVSSEDYTPAFVDNMYITGNAWGTIGGTAMASWGGQNHSNQKLTNESGKGVIIVRDVSAGSNHEFKIYGTKGDNSVTGIDLFNAPYVDMVNKPSKLTWQNIGSSSIFGYPIPMSDNQWRNITFQVSEKIDMKITFDGAVVSMAELPKYTVSFNKNGATSADIPSQTMYEGLKATKPADPVKEGGVFVGWKLNNEVFDFTTPITASIELVAAWELPHINGVSLDKTEATIYLADTRHEAITTTLVPTIDPAALVPTAEWSTSNPAIATVLNGVVTPVAEGTATITYKATDSYSVSKQATCQITVRPGDEYCAKTDHQLASSIEKKNMYTTDLPATCRIVKIRFNNNYYAHIVGTGNNAVPNISTDDNSTTNQWYEISAGTYSPSWTSKTYNLYYLKNVATGKYLCRGNGQYGGNSDWYYYVTTAVDAPTGDACKWFYDDTQGNHIVCREGAGNTLNKSYMMSICNVDGAGNTFDVYGAKPKLVCHYAPDPQNNVWTKLHGVDVVSASVPTPGYLAPTMVIDEKTYSRMTTESLVKLTLNSAIVKKNILRMYLYADAATSVKLSKNDDTTIETINLAANQVKVFEKDLTALAGETILKLTATDSHAFIYTIEGIYQTVDDPIDPQFAWVSPAPAAKERHFISDGTFTFAVSHIGSKAVDQYESSNPAVATVSNAGLVTPLTTGHTIITASLEADGCYAGGELSYDLYVFDGYYVAGTINGGDWSPNQFKMTDGVKTFENLAAGEHKFKVTTGFWESDGGLVYHYSAFKDANLKGKAFYTDNNNNICFTLVNAGDVTITYNNGEVTVSTTAALLDPKCEVFGGQGSDFNGHKMTVAADGKTCSFRMYMGDNEQYNFKIKDDHIGGDNAWLSNETSTGMTRTNHTDWLFIHVENKCYVKTNNAGDYTFVYNYSTHKVSVLFPNVYVDFDTKGGSSIERQSVPEGGLATEPAVAPTKENMTFGRWEKDNTPFDFSTPIYVNTTLSAVYTCEVTFKNGTETVASETCDEGGTVTFPANPERTGCTFNRWVNESGTAVTEATIINKNSTFSAIYKATITFDSNGGSSVDPITVDADQAAVKPADPTRTDGASFVEWLYNGVSFDWSTPITEDITLTALWDVLQDRADAVEGGGTLTLTHDYMGGDLTVNKKLTINAGGHKIGNLTITTEGDLTLSSAMTANDLLIASNQSVAVSGQLKGAANLTLEGNAYIDIQFAGTNAITQGWYAFTVPFTVSSTSGVYNANTGAKLINEDDYAIMQYQGDVRAQGKYGWIKTHKVGGKLYAGTFYIISLGDTEYNIIRFMMDKGSAIAASTSMNISEYAYSGSGTSNDAGWNGVGNPNLYYANAAIDGLSKLQTYSHDNDAYTAEDISGKNLIVGLPFFVQATADGTMTTSMAATTNAPQRMLANQQTNEEFMLELSQDNKLQDRIYLSADDDASANYEIGRELIKMTMGTAKVAQIAINGYNMSLCDAEFVLTNNQALFPLTLTAPKAGNYTLSVKRACEGQDLFVMNGSQVVWDLTQGDYILSLPQGTTTSYSLLLQVGDHKMPTGNDAVKATSEGVQKIILHNELRILKDGKMFNAQGIQL